MNGLNRAKDFCGQPQHWDCDFPCVVLLRRPIGQTNLVSLVRDVIERGSCGDSADCGCAPVVRLHEVGRSLQTGWQPILWIL